MAKRGVHYLLCHGPKVHRELSGMSARDAILLFIKESCRLEDVPVTYYRLQKVRGQRTPVSYRTRRSSSSSSSFFFFSPAKKGEFHHVGADE